MALKLGMKVRHPQFGVGTVLSVEALDDDTKLVVRFVARRPEDAAREITRRLNRNRRTRLTTPRNVIMKRNGSVYVAVVFAVLIGYFGYQWWFNPSRAVKRQMGEVAAVLSVPAERHREMARIARLAQLRRYLADDIRIRAGPGNHVARRHPRRGECLETPGRRHRRTVRRQCSSTRADGATRILTVEVTDAGSARRTADCGPAGHERPPRETGRAVGDHHCGIEGRHQGARVRPRTTPVIISPEMVTRRVFAPF